MSTLPSDENRRNRKIVLIVIAIVLAIIALVTVLIMVLSKDEPNDQNDDGSGQAAPTISQGGQSDGGVAPYTGMPNSSAPTGGNGPSSPGPGDEEYTPNNPAPTTLRIKKAPDNKDNSDAYNDDPMDPANATPSDVSMQALAAIFSVSLTTDGHVWDSFHKADKFMTDQAKRDGFKIWWEGDRNGHTFAWISGSTSDGTNSIIADPHLVGESWIDNTTLKMRWRVGQVLTAEKGAGNLPDFTVVTTMKYTGNKWLMDKYVYDYDSYPSLH